MGHEERPEASPSPLSPEVGDIYLLEDMDGRDEALKDTEILKKTEIRDKHNLETLDQPLAIIAKVKMSVCLSCLSGLVTCVEDKTQNMETRAGNSAEVRKY